ncbi:MAG: hypothetical protein IJR45_06155 [Firmicutes bacterium]|nr:hypothetical protein [Bacillota bacterium]
MTKLQERAIGMIEKLPDEKIAYVIGFLESMDIETPEKNIERSMRAFENLQKYRKKGTDDIDCKKEIEEEMIKKYESIN